MGIDSVITAQVKQTEKFANTSQGNFHCLYRCASITYVGKSHFSTKDDFTIRFEVLHNADHLTSSYRIFIRRIFNH